MKVNTKKKSKEALIKERRNKIAECLRERKSFREIIPEVGVSLGTIHNDVKAIFDEWREMRVTNVDDVMMTELSRLLWVIEEAQQQWEASKNRTRKKLKYRASKLDDTGKPKEGVKPDEFEVTTFHAERQYLETIVTASESLRKLLGVDKPSKHAITDPEGENDFISLTLQELRRRINTLVEEPGISEVDNGKRRFPKDIPE